MELFHKKIDLFKKKNTELSDEDILNEIEQETGISNTRKPLPPPPAIQRTPISMPMPSQAQREMLDRASSYKPQNLPQQAAPRATAIADISDATMMDKPTVAKLPLFMRVEEYDRILSEVNKVAESLKNMEDILDNLTKLEEDQTAQTRKWRGQLEITKTQVKQLISHMPETGKLKELVQIKKQQQKTQSLKKELTGLGTELKRAARQPSREAEEMQQQVSAMKSDMQAEMKNLQEQVKSIAEIVKQTAVQQQKQQAQGFQKSDYKKVDEKKPW